MTAWARWGEWANSVIRNWSRSITMWNLALDEKGTPYIGVHEEGDIIPGAPTTGRRVITIDSATCKISRSGRFWALAHYSKHVRREGLRHEWSCRERRATFQEPCLSRRISQSRWKLCGRALQPPSREAVQLVLGSSSLVVELPADSVHTLQWSQRGTLAPSVPSTQPKSLTRGSIAVNSFAI